MDGKSEVVECAFVKSDLTPAPYFANPILLGKQGMQKNLGLGELSDFEKKKVDEVCVLSFPNAWWWLQVHFREFTLYHYHVLYCRHFLSYSRISRKEKNFKQS